MIEIIFQTNMTSSATALNSGNLKWHFMNPIKDIWNLSYNDANFWPIRNKTG